MVKKGTLSKMPMKIKVMAQMLRVSILYDPRGVLHANL